MRATNSEKRVSTFTNGLEWKSENILSREVELLKFATERWTMNSALCDRGQVHLPDEFKLINQSAIQLPDVGLVEDELDSIENSHDDIVDDVYK